MRRRAPRGCREGSGIQMTDGSECRKRKSFIVFLLALLAIGFISRVLPLLDQDGRVIRQFPTEDGYLMLTIARNMALGHGMSTAGGTIPTNGRACWRRCSRDSKKGNSSEFWKSGQAELQTPFLCCSKKRSRSYINIVICIYTLMY